MKEVTQDKPLWPACERNKVPILEILRREFAGASRVLEIGSGTGQHAAYFAAELSHLVWQTSDVAENHPAILAWIADSRATNLRAPIALDVDRDAWPEANSFDAIFSANTAHIMSWREVLAMLDGVSDVLETGGSFCIYGPFAYDGEHTSESNRAFDAMLRERDPQSGVRDAQLLAVEAAARGLRRVRDHDMPANNKILVFHREDASA
jgi:cyclopropane fatty-acyl-phospholipid synthase-like methyltransferase